MTGAVLAAGAPDFLLQPAVVSTAAVNIAAGQRAYCSRRIP